ncbi:MAG: CidA/LrgA family protein [Acidaminococcaceae bacterium]|nr:CidA/LrgA family protein [Acidaminococcaceae bacterium]MBQ9696940.1 CidA/LrgA family protein [Acidaminococcaceae bacterium]
MKYLKQFTVVLLFAFIGEALHFLLPLPVPASIYGLIVLFLFLYKKIILPEDIKETASFLIEIMPLFFIPSAAGLVRIWNLIAAICVPLTMIAVIATFAVIAVTGKAVQFVINFAKEKADLQQTDTCFFNTNVKFYGR